MHHLTHITICLISIFLSFCQRHFQAHQLFFPAHFDPRARLLLDMLVVCFSTSLCFFTFYNNTWSCKPTLQCSVLNLVIFKIFFSNDFTSLMCSKIHFFLKVLPKQSCLIYSFIHLFIYLFVYLFIYLVS